MSNSTYPLLDEQKSKKNLLKSSVGVAAVGIGSTVAVVESASAQDTSQIQAVEGTVNALGGIVAAVVTIVLSAMGVRMAIKQVNRVSVRG